MNKNTLVGGWLAIACVFVAVAGRAQAADQLISGDLYMTDATPKLQLQLPGPTPTPVLSIHYEPASSGVPGAIFSIDNSAAEWEWQRYTGVQNGSQWVYDLQMVLGTDNQLELFPVGQLPTSTNPPKIVLNPNPSDPYIAIGGYRVLTRSNVGTGILTLGQGVSNTKFEVWGNGVGAGIGFGIGNDDFRLHTAATSNQFSFRPTPTAAPNVVFKGNGNVGIGTESPQAKLEVAGDVRSSGLLIEKKVEFTPTAAGWYRVVWGHTMVGGMMRITGAYDNAFTDVELQFNIAGYGNAGAIQQTRFSSYNLGVVSDARIGSSATQGELVYVDIYVRTAVNPAPITIYAYGPHKNGFFWGEGIVASPVVGASTTGMLPRGQLKLGHGFRSTQGANFAVFTGNVGIGTEAPVAKLHVAGAAKFDGVVRVARGGDISMGSFTAGP